VHDARQRDDSFAILAAFEHNCMEAFVRISARNILKGRIAEVRKGETTTHVRLDIGGMTVVSSITNEAADELKLSKGQEASAVIKASDVMVGVD
jgi:molybdopterin-binding protein